MNSGAIVSPPANSSEVSSHSTRPSFRAMKPSRLAAMWIVTRDFVFSIVTPRCRAQWMFVPQSLAAPDQPAWLLVILRAVKGLACGLLVSLVCWAPLVAQERDR